ncbi:hypothetical protein Dip510_001623 [Elusimicrobium posterum]|uniref:hypothetical protein n=1 Tax=Elusimicrobium posterum TaxID=3116653 RepID=UPI003C719D06
MTKNYMTGPKFYLGKLLEQNYPDLEKEFMFAKEAGRRFRADYHIPSLQVLVEYEGVFMAQKSRHTSVLGYTNDCEKYNMAQLLGYTILRYTAKNYSQVLQDLKYLKNSLKVGGSD